MTDGLAKPTGDAHEERTARNQEAPPPEAPTQEAKKIEGPPPTQEPPQDRPAKPESLAQAESLKTAEEEELQPTPPEPSPKALHEEEEVEEPEPQKKALHEEEEAHDLDEHEKLAVEEEAEDIEEEIAPPSPAVHKARARRANIIGFAVNAMLLLIVIWLVKVKLASKPAETSAPATEAATGQPSEGPTAGQSPPPPPVATPEESLNPEGTPAHELEDALRAKQLKCNIQKLTLNPKRGALMVVFRKEAFWDIEELRKDVIQDSLACLRTAFGTAHVKTINLVIEGRLDQKPGGGHFEMLLSLTADREAYEASGLATNQTTTIPPSLNPRYHKIFEGGKQ